MLKQNRNPERGRTSGIQGTWRLRVDIYYIAMPSKIGRLGRARGGRASFSPRGGQDGGDLDPLFGLEHLTLAEDVVPEALARALRDLAVLRRAGKSLRLDQPADGYRKITSTSFGQIFVLGTLGLVRALSLRDRSSSRAFLDSEPLAP